MGASLVEHTAKHRLGTSAVLDRATPGIAVDQGCESRSPAILYFDLFDEAALDRLESAVFRTLSEVGCVVQDEAILDALESAGSTVDRSTQTARFPEKLALEVTAEQKRHPWQPPRATQPFAQGPFELGVGLHVAQFYYDWAKQKRRPGNVEDFLHVVRFGDGHGVGPVDHPLLLRDEPPMVECLEALYLLLEHSSRPGGTYLHYGQQAPYLAEIGEIWSNDRTRFLSACVFAATPLRFDRRGCSVFRAMVHHGLAPWVGTMAVSGASAPITPAGAIVTGAAECLAGWIILRILGTDPPYGAGVATGSLNMRTGHAGFGSPEAMLQDLGAVELCRRRWGGHVGVAGQANYTDARTPGIQAAYERSLEGLWVAAVAGSHPNVGSGLIDSGKTLCLEQLIIDEEVGRAHWRVASGLEVTDETIDLKDILAVGTGQDKSHMETEHTLKHYRECYHNRLFDVSPYADGDEDARNRRVLERAHEIVVETEKQYVPPDVDRHKLAAVRKVIDRARADLAHE